MFVFQVNPYKKESSQLDSLDSKTANSLIKSGSEALKSSDFTPPLYRRAFRYFEAAVAIYPMCAGDVKKALEKASDEAPSLKGRGMCLEEANKYGSTRGRKPEEYIGKIPSTVPADGDFGRTAPEESPPPGKRSKASTVPPEDSPPPGKRSK